MATGKEDGPRAVAREIVSDKTHLVIPAATAGLPPPLVDALLSYLLTLSSLSIALVAAVGGYIFAAHSLHGPGNAFLMALLTGGVTFMTVKFGVGVGEDAADALFLCHKLDLAAGTEHSPDVYEAVSGSVQPLHFNPADCLCLCSSKASANQIPMSHNSLPFPSLNRMASPSCSIDSAVHIASFLGSYPVRCLWACCLSVCDSLLAQRFGLLHSCLSRTGSVAHFAVQW